MSLLVTVNGLYTIFIPAFSSLLAASECDVNNGGCEHNCTETVASYTCSCYPGYTLQEDEHTCIGKLIKII